MRNYKLKAINSVFGYERNQTVFVSAIDKKDALEIGRKIDSFADITEELQK